MLFGHFDRLLRLFEVGARHHELDASRIHCSLQDTFKVVFVGLFPVVDAAEDSVTKVDADLQAVVSCRTWSICE